MNHAGSEIQSTNPSERVAFRDLGVGEQLSMMWSWWWREMVLSAVATVVAIVPFSILGGIVGGVLAAQGRDPVKAIAGASFLIQVSAVVVASVAGFFSMFWLIKWVTGERLGKYEVHIVRVPPAPAEPEGKYVCDRCNSPVVWGQSNCPTCGERLEYDESGDN
jgi:hypothetical protein